MFKQKNIIEQVPFNYVPRFGYAVQDDFNQQEQSDGNTVGRNKTTFGMISSFKFIVEVFDKIRFNLKFNLKFKYHYLTFNMVCWNNQTSPYSPLGWDRNRSWKEIQKYRNTVLLAGTATVPGEKYRKKEMQKYSYREKTEIHSSWLGQQPFLNRNWAG